jgi:hypothetical protein
MLYHPHLLHPNKGIMYYSHPIFFSLFLSGMFSHTSTQRSANADKVGATQNVICVNRHGFPQEISCSS